MFFNSIPIHLSLNSPSKVEGVPAWQAGAYAFPSSSSFFFRLMSLISLSAPSKNRCKVTTIFLIVQVFLHIF